MHTEDAQVLDDKPVCLTRSSDLIGSPNARLEPDRRPVGARHGILDESACFLTRTKDQNEIDRFGDVTEIRVAHATEEALSRGIHRNHVEPFGREVRRHASRRLFQIPRQSDDSNVLHVTKKLGDRFRRWVIGIGRSLQHASELLQFVHKARAYPDPGWLATRDVPVVPAARLSPPRRCRRLWPAR